MKKSPVTFLAICWVCGTLFFWWLTCKTKPQFLGAAVLAGLVSAMALARITILAELAARFEPRWFWLLCRRLLPKIFSDLALLARALAHSRAGHGGTGTFRAVPFHHGGGDAKSTGRRALVFAGMSLPPNSFAVTMQGNRELLQHQLVFSPEPEPANREWPL